MEKRNKRILLVDDDELLRGILATMLSDYTVIEADNGKTAVELYRIHKPDLVLMDIIMPVMDGVAATKEILKEDPSAVILAITAFGTLRGKEMIEAGAKELISKPITRKGLNEVVEKYLKTEKV
ncbi:response regulator [Archaeoglobales archaeon]|nr:MAG: response regulator [Archaeoglobales archaeon]